MKLTREILKRMILKEATAEDFKYKQSTFSSPNIAVPSMTRRANPFYDPNKSDTAMVGPNSDIRNKKFLPSNMPEEYSESFKNFLNKQPSFVARIAAINRITKAIENKDFNELQKVFGITTYQTPQSSIRTVLNACLCMDFMSHVAREQDAMTGAYLFEGLTALIAGGQISGGEGLAHDAVDANGNYFSSKFYGLKSAGSQAVAGFTLNKSVTYLIAQKTTDQESYGPAKEKKVIDFDYTQQATKPRRMSDPEKYKSLGKITGTSDPIEIKTIHFFAVKVEKTQDGTQVLPSNLINDSVIHKEIQGKLTKLFDTLLLNNQPLPPQLREKAITGYIDSLSKKLYGFKSKAYKEALLVADYSKDSNHPGNKSLIDAVTRLAKAYHKKQIFNDPQITAPKFSVKAIDSKGQEIPAMSVPTEWKYDKALDQYIQVTKSTKRKDLFTITANIGTGNVILWRINLSPIVSTPDVFFRNRTAYINLVSSNGSLLKDELEATLKDMGEQSIGSPFVRTKEKLFKTAFLALRSYFESMDKSEKQVRLYLANGDSQHAKDGLNHAKDTTSNLEKLFKLMGLK